MSDLVHFDGCLMNFDQLLYVCHPPASATDKRMIAKFTGKSDSLLVATGTYQKMCRYATSRQAGPMLVAADWLEDHDFNDAAAALRKEFAP